MRVNAFDLFALTILAIASWLSVSALAWAGRRMSARVWICGGLLNLAGLFLPVPIFVKIFPARLSQPFESPMAITLLLILSMALVTAALLLNSGLNLFEMWRNTGVPGGGDSQAQPKHVGKTALFVLALGSVLLAKALYNFYWFMVWDTTYDSLEYLWLAIPVPAVLFSSAVLSFALPGRTKCVRKKS